jgi:hypothetical protein
VVLRVENAAISVDGTFSPIWPRQRAGKQGCTER